MTFLELIHEQSIWDEWQSNYKNFVPKFIEEAKSNKDVEHWNQEVFSEFFMRSSDQCVSSLRQGYFNHAEKDRIIKQWSELSPLLQKIALSQDIPLFEVYDDIKEFIRKHTDSNKKAATNRLIASLQPKLLCTVVNEQKLNSLIYLLNNKVEDFNLGIKSNWFENSYQLFQEFKSKIKNEDGYEIVTLPWQVYEYFLDNEAPKNIENNDMSESINTRYLDILKYKKQIILQGPPGTGKTRAAKSIAQEMLGLSFVQELETSEQFKLVQFHPGYMYDDFVRGIVATPDEDAGGIIYEAENKVLGKITKAANENYIRSKVDSTIAHTKSDLQRFKDYVISKLDESPEQKFQISNNVYIFHVDDYRFKYKGDNWTTHSHGLNMNFSELEKIIKNGYTERSQINKAFSLNSLTRSHATYFANVIDLYNNFVAYEDQNTIGYEPLKNYVLIIDEINRANLSSVLGELIYALEYRGETVESMYEVEGSRELTLPPNLYIIGTMNTADRSVGNIDYAIRRRFAFVDVLPEIIEDNEKIFFNAVDFARVSQLFNDTNVSREFKIKDVQLGHSYFIANTKDAETEDDKNKIFRMKMNYEVIPILLEYVKDGILIGTYEGKDIESYIQSLEKTE